jgi:hypothetical protein
MTQRQVVPIALAAIVVAWSCSPSPRHLKYVSRMQMQPSTVAMQSDPILESIGRSVAAMVLPGGSMQMTTIVGEYGVRLEWDRALPGIPAGAAMVYSAADGTSAVVNAAEKTYWTLPPSAVADLFPAGAKPQVTSAMTGDKDTIAGVATERMTFEIRMPLPAPPDRPRPPGMPAEITMSGEAWVAGHYGKYLGSVSKLPAMNALGMDALAQHGLQMKQVLRSPVFGAQQLETLVTSVSEERVAADLFKVPAGYREIAPGGGAGR